MGSTDRVVQQLKGNKIHNSIARLKTVFLVTPIVVNVATMATVKTCYISAISDAAVAQDNH